MEAHDGSSQQRVIQPASYPVHHLAVGLVLLLGKH